METCKRSVLLAVVLSTGAWLAGNAEASCAWKDLKKNCDQPVCNFPVEICAGALNSSGTRSSTKIDVNLYCSPKGRRALTEASYTPSAPQDMTVRRRKLGRTYVKYKVANVAAQSQTLTFKLSCGDLLR